MTQISRIKIFGERNTGTNYLTKVLQDCSAAQVLLGDAPRRLSWRLARRVLPKGSRLRGQAWKYEERFEERWLTRNFETHLGWKHMRLDLDRLEPLATPDLAVLLLVKHPYPWLLSLHKRPYIVGSGTMTFAEFLTSPLKVLPRHGLPGPAYSPMALWNLNMQSYLEALERMPQVRLIRSEDLLRDPEGLVQGVLKDWNVPLRANLAVDRPSTKGEAKSTSDYQDYYLNERWRGKLDAEAYALMENGLDSDLAQAAGYRLGSSE